MIRALNSKLGIPAEILIAKPRKPARKAHKKIIAGRNAFGAKRAG
jgi:hypothetical protein